MTKKDRIIGPVLTLTVMAIYHWLSTQFDFIPVAVALFWPFVVWAAFVGGLRSALIAALVVSGYAYLALPDQLPRVVIITAGSIATALMVGVLKRREIIQHEAIDDITTNGNVEKVQRALETTRALRAELNQNEWAMKGLDSIEHDLAHSLAIINGFSHLWQEIQEVEKWYRFPQNVLRWRKWNEWKER